VNPRYEQVRITNLRTARLFLEWFYEAYGLTLPLRDVSCRARCDLRRSIFYFVVVFRSLHYRWRRLTPLRKRLRFKIDTYMYMPLNIPI